MRELAKKREGENYIYHYYIYFTEIKDEKELNL